jgi:curved DNA-binding protein CbpA
MIESEKNYYEILEVYPAAKTEEIETAYRLLLYKYHPDHNPDRGDWAHQMTSKVVEAYGCLSDPAKRQYYNFQIYSPVKKKPPEKKFWFFQAKQKQQWELALAKFTAGVALFPRQKTKALLKFQEAISHWPKFPEALFNLGLCLVDMHKLADARGYFKRVQDMLPNDPEIKRVFHRLDELKS